MTLLEISNVRKDYGGLRAVDNVSFSLEKERICGLIGPNGSGKSTLINLMAGSTDLTKGQIHFNGTDISHASSDERFQHGIVRGYQTPSLFFRMTVLDNMLLAVKDQQGERPWYAPWRRFWHDQETAHAQRAVEVMQQVSLYEQANTLASDLSGGQMKLLEIARALMANPELLLLDEPAAGVAPKLAVDIFEQIAHLRDEQGITFLIVEHRLEILFNYVDYVYVMHLGNLLAEGTPEDISNNQTVRELYFGD